METVFISVAFRLPLNPWNCPPEVWRFPPGSFFPPGSCRPPGGPNLPNFVPTGRGQGQRVAQRNICHGKRSPHWVFFCRAQPQIPSWFFRPIFSGAGPLGGQNNPRIRRDQPPVQPPKTGTIRARAEKHCTLVRARWDRGQTGPQEPYPRTRSQSKNLRLRCGTPGVGSVKAGSCFPSSRANEENRTVSRSPRPGAPNRGQPNGPPPRGLLKGNGAVRSVSPLFAEGRGDPRSPQ